MPPPKEEGGGSGSSGIITIILGYGISTKPIEQTKPDKPEDATNARFKGLIWEGHLDGD
jgi:hypothetical protein